MQLLYLILSLFFAILSLSAIGKYLSGAEPLFVIIFPLLGTIFFGYKYKKPKKKTNTVKAEPKKPTNPILINFFEKPTEELAKEFEASLDANISQEKKNEMVYNSIENIIELALEDGIITNEEEDKITDYMGYFGVSSGVLPYSVQEKLIKGLVIRDLLEGNISSRIVIPQVPFNFMKSETIIYAFPNVPLYEVKTENEYVGGSQGMSFRVAKGMYYRVGSYRGNKVEKQVTKDLGKSAVAITSKHIYFMTHDDSMRIRHSKIVSIRPSENGVTVFRDGARNNPLFFEVEDVWFFANVLQNAQNWESA